MSGIVIELQKEALNENVSIESLLRKSYVISRKLKLKDFGEWVQCELEGYEKHEVPEYRRIQGQLKALNPVRGWIPVVMDSALAEIAFTKTKLSNSIPELYHLYQDKENTMLVINLPAQTNKYVSKCCGYETQYRLEFGKNQIYSILSQVRNNILDWALMLEENGIVGKDYSFSDEEQEIAHKKCEVTNYITNFWGNASEVQLQQGSIDSKQSSM